MGKQLRKAIGRVAATTLKVLGAATLDSTLTVSGNTDVTGTFDVTGNSTFTGTFGVTGATDVTGTLDVTDVTTVEEFVQQPTDADADGAIAVRSGVVRVTKAGVAALTLADPVAADEGKVLIITSTTAQAHTIDNTAGSGFDGAGAAGDFATLGGAIGDGLVLVAAATVWNVLVNKNATLS
jgi:hypothetical protein